MNNEPHFNSLMPLIIQIHVYLGLNPQTNIGNETWELCATPQFFFPNIEANYCQKFRSLNIVVDL